MFISVLVDTYNHERFIERAISSVLAQDFPASDFEVIVVDDGSTDRTPEIVRRFEPRVHLLQKVNGGQASAFNTGIPRCQGEIIAFLDGDDWWAPQKLSRVAELFAEDEAVGFVGHALLESYLDGTQHLLSPGVRHRFRLDSAASANFFRLHRCYMGTSRMAIRSSIARRLLPVPESLVIEADEYLFTLAPVLAHAVLLPEPLTHYRLHGGNLYMAWGSVAGGERRMQQVYASLAAELRKALPRYGAPPEAAAAVLEMVEAQASQLRLKLDGGSSWETFRTESFLFRAQHPHATWKSRAFRHLSMIPALLLPPRWFYGGRQWIGAQSWYKKLRRSFVPVPQEAAGHLQPAKDTARDR